MKMAQMTLATGLAIALVGFAAPISVSAQSANSTKVVKIAATDASQMQQDRQAKMKRKYRWRGHYRRACGSYAERRGQRLTGLIDDLFELNSVQQKAFGNLKVAMKDGLAGIKQVCADLPKRQKAAKGKKRVPLSILQRLETREKLMTAKLASLQKFRPAFASFFNSLSEKQRRGLGRIMSRGRRGRR